MTHRYETVLEILQYRDYPVAPWKNGQGVTREIMKYEPDDHGFMWRLSLADVGQSGPFSEFVGYDRTITLLGGDGFSLNFDDGTVAVLDSPHKPYEFDGGVSLRCDLLGGVSQDLNLMVRRGHLSAAWQVLDLDPRTPLSLQATPGVSHVIFCLAGGADVASPGDPSHVLGAWDSALLDVSGGAGARTGDRDVDRITITAALNSVSQLFHVELRWP